MQINSSYSNYTEDAVTCPAAQQHSTFTVQLVYKFYHLLLHCIYSNYTEAAGTCSDEQQDKNFTVEILYKPHGLQLNCT